MLKVSPNFIGIFCKLPFRSFIERSACGWHAAQDAPNHIAPELNPNAIVTLCARVVSNEESAARDNYRVDVNRFLFGLSCFRIGNCFPLFTQWLDDFFLFILQNSIALLLFF